MKNLIIVVLSLLILNISTVFADEAEEICEKCLSPTLIVRHNPTGGHGTGFIVKSEKQDDYYINIVITCNHVLRTYNIRDYSIVLFLIEDQVYTNKTMSSAVHIVYRDKEIDLAVLYFTTSFQMPVVDIDLSQIRIGEAVQSAGCSKMTVPRINQGIVTYASTYQDIIYNSTFTLRGDSGGPLFRDKKVIGWQTAISSVKSLESNPQYQKEIPLNHICKSHALSWADRTLKTTSKLYDFILHKNKKIPMLLKLQSDLDIYYIQ